MHATACPSDSNWGDWDPGAAADQAEGLSWLPEGPTSFTGGPPSLSTGEWSRTRPSVLPVFV